MKQGVDREARYRCTNQWITVSKVCELYDRPKEDDDNNKQQQNSLFRTKIYIKGNVRGHPLVKSLRLLQNRTLRQPKRRHYQSQLNCESSVDVVSLSSFS